MALVVHAKPGLEVLAHLKRLTLLSSNYATSTGVISGTSTLGSTFSPKAEVFPPCHRHHLGVQPLLLGGVRYKHSKRVNYEAERKTYKEYDKEAIHSHGFSYYPRFPNHQDPPIEPTKLFMVKRIRSLYGTPHWEKRLIRKLDLEDRRTVGIFKNTPSVNKMLYSIKHLIEITPITMPYGMPDSPENAFLKENGQLVSYNPLKLHDENGNFEGAVELYKEHRNKTIERKALEHRLHLRWYSRFDIV